MKRLLIIFGFIFLNLLLKSQGLPILKDSVSYNIKNYNSFVLLTEKDTIPSIVFITPAGNITSCLDSVIQNGEVDTFIYLQPIMEKDTIKSTRKIKASNLIGLIKRISINKFIQVKFDKDTINNYFPDYVFYKNQYTDSDLRYIDSLKRCYLLNYSFLFNSFSEKPLIEYEDSIVIRLTTPNFPINSTFSCCGVDKFDIKTIRFSNKKAFISRKEGRVLNDTLFYTCQKEINIEKEEKDLKHILKYLNSLSFKNPTQTFKPYDNYSYNNSYPELIEFKVGNNYYCYLFRSIRIDLADWNKNERVKFEWIFSVLNKEMRNLK